MAQNQGEYLGEECLSSVNVRCGELGTDLGGWWGRGEREKEEVWGLAAGEHVDRFSGTW